MNIPKHSTYVIAEVGSNHGGSLRVALDHIDACAAAGVDAVKFQSWTARGLQNPFDVAENGDLIPSKVLPILAKFELPEDWHSALAERCFEKGVDFLSTPFEISRARLLRDLGVSAIKISSSDLTYDELLSEVGAYGLPIFLSTGMANMQEIAHALDLLGRDRDDITLLQCTAAYPPKIEDANLRAITTLQRGFNVRVGLSDHYPGHDMVVAALALGASVIEKHVTISRSAGTPDAQFAIEMEELSALVNVIRSVELALGDGKKLCRHSERDGLRGGRRGLFAARSLKVGDILSREAIAIVRPNISELQPGDLSAVLDKQVLCDIPAGTPLRWQHVTL